MNSFLHGKFITHMTVDYTDSNAIPQQDVLHFFYDVQSRPAQVKFNNVIYTYVHNLQGDIVGLLDSAGVLAVEYRYDAWGKPLSVTGNLAETLGKRNPFRYRGYVYDEETGLYYLRSRYYNPEVGRFVNADTMLGKVGGLGSHNVYAYCANTPAITTDPDGYRYTYDAIDAYAKPPMSEELAMRLVINTVCGRTHASGNGKFSVTSVTPRNTITAKQAESYNAAVSDFVDTVAFAFGAILGSNAKGWVKKAVEAVAFQFLAEKATGSVQDFFVDAFTVRAGTYTSIECRYERNFKFLFFLPGVEVHSYELRLYPDYCEVWYSYLYSGFSSTITAPQKIGEKELY